MMRLTDLKPLPRHDITSTATPSGPRGKVYLRTLGCPKNEADGSALVRHLEAAGWEVVDDPAHADAEIVNTCGFIEQTKVESLDAIFEAVERKNGGPRRLIVTGCLAQRYPQQLAGQIEGLDAIVGFNRPELVEQALRAPRANGAPACWVEKPDAVYREHTTHWTFDARHPAPLSAYVKVGDGCDNACRFCAIPLIRGRLRSRSPEAIVAEVSALVEHGSREIILVSQDTTSWGLDLPDHPGLDTLLERLNDIPGDFWIRVMYAHPAFLREEHIAAIGACEKVVPYLDMPLQHISDRMLRIMNRHTTRQETQAKIDALRRVRPGITLRTTFIIGHPGETTSDFEELLAFAADNAFERMGGFTYSAEEGTPAARFRGRVRAAVARERLERLNDAYDRWSSAQSVDRIGSRIRCLIERRLDDGSWEGRGPFDAPDIDGRVILPATDRITPGFHPVLIRRADGVDLHAVSAEKPAPLVLEKTP
ncbi:MAG TPA: 30S ribosomal protein S12 methylthiotransferase RimO [bacterium]|nr:30S ribosomal protein S12 methylthiotransferase RimO [bacterium]